MFGEGELSGFLQSHRQVGGTTGNESALLIFFKAPCFKKKPNKRHQTHCDLYGSHTGWVLYFGYRLKLKASGNDDWTWVNMVPVLVQVSRFLVPASGEIGWANWDENKVEAVQKKSLSQIMRRLFCKIKSFLPICHHFPLNGSVSHLWPLYQFVFAQSADCCHQHKTHTACEI